MKLLKRLVYDKLVKKVNVIQTINTSDLVKKADYDTKIEDIETKFPIMINVLMRGNFVRR